MTTAALACYRPGCGSRLIWRQHVWRRRKGEAKSFTWRGYADLLIAAHRQPPGGKIVLIWDNLSVHQDTRMREFIDRTDRPPAPALCARAQPGRGSLKERARPPVTRKTLAGEHRPTAAGQLQVQQVRGEDRYGFGSSAEASARDPGTAGESSKQNSPVIMSVTMGPV